jgi:uncharacterized SAM-binding protein YcdF (DUF218 family)
MSLVKVLTWLASPYGFFVWGVALSGLLLAWSRRGSRMHGLGRALGLAAIAQLVLFSWYPVVDLLARPLENRARQLAAQAPPGGYAAIVVLGGALRPAQPSTGETIGFSASATRVWAAAQLYKAGLAPRVIASGGTMAAASGASVPSEAQAMRDVLVALGVPAAAIVMDEDAFTTRESARHLHRTVGTTGRVALVTSAYHMRRALIEMQAAGLDAYAFPTEFHTLADTRPSFEEWLPSADALRFSSVVIKEWLGLAAQALGLTGP